MARLLLLGDSVIDNGSYVKSGEPDVARQVRAVAPQYEIELRAVDGSVTADVLRAQLHDLHSDDIVVLSSGGNDALQRIELLNSGSESTSRKLLVDLWEVRESFRFQYAALLTNLRQEPRRVLVMSVYNPNFASRGMELSEQKAAEAGLSIFNDVIQQEALAHGCDILELRTLFNDDADYANPIEPSMAGGAKIAARIKAWVEQAQ